MAGEREALRLELDGLAERRQVAAQLLQRVHPVRAALADHERVERQVAAHVGAVVDQVPGDERVAGQLRRGEQAGGVGRQVQPQDLRRAAADPAEPLRLAIAEDRAEVGGRAARRSRTSPGTAPRTRSRSPTCSRRTRPAGTWRCRSGSPARPPSAATAPGRSAPRSRCRSSRSACTSGRRRGARCRRDGPARAGTPRSSAGSPARRTRPRPTVEILAQRLDVVGLMREVRQERLRAAP